MVLLRATHAAKAAIDLYLSQTPSEHDDDVKQRLERLQELDVGGPIEHADLIHISSHLRRSHKSQHGSDEPLPKSYRLEAILKGAAVYQPPPPPKPEPSPEYKALMQRLRNQEEQRQYERMLNPLPEKETFNQRFPNAAGGTTFNPNTYHGQTGVDDVDDTTYQDVERQMALIINVLVSIVACAVAFWIVARHWSVPQRLALSMGGSLTVAAAEVVIYFGYIRRIQDAKTKEIKHKEKREVAESWVIEKASNSGKGGSENDVRYRKGRHR